MQVSIPLPLRRPRPTAGVAVVLLAALDHGGVQQHVAVVAEHGGLGVVQLQGAGWARWVGWVGGAVQGMAGGRGWRAGAPGAQG